MAARAKSVTGIMLVVIGTLGGLLASAMYVLCTIGCLDDLPLLVAILVAAWIGSAFGVLLFAARARPWSDAWRAAGGYSLVLAAVAALALSGLPMSGVALALAQPVAALVAMILLSGRR